MIKVERNSILLIIILTLFLPILNFKQDIYISAFRLQ